jgi:hypothetical protein
MIRTSLVGLTVIALASGISVAGTPAEATSAPVITTASTGPAGPMQLSDADMDTVTAGAGALVVRLGTVLLGAAGSLGASLIERGIRSQTDVNVLGGPNVKKAAGQCGCPQ